MISDPFGSTSSGSHRDAEAQRPPSMQQGVVLTNSIPNGEREKVKVCHCADGDNLPCHQMAAHLLAKENCSQKCTVFLILLEK